MEPFENCENKICDINLEDFPFICRICLRRGDLRLVEAEDYLLGLFNLFVTITKINVHSTVNFPSSICNQCISKLEDISLFIDISKYNNASRENNLIPTKENISIVNCGLSQEYAEQTGKTTEEYKEDICLEESEICRICSLTSCLTPFEEKAHLMQLFQNITDIDVEAEANFSERNSICNKCINEVENISSFISFSLCNDMKLKNATGRDEALKTEGCLEESASDISSSKWNVIKFEGISDINELKIESYSDENASCYESKDFHAVDIKEEYFHSPEVSVSQNHQNNLEFCSETNSVDKPLECDPCKNEFSTENHLKIIPHGMESNLKAQIMMKEFICDFCEKRFNSKRNLQQHMPIHTGVKPFKCDYCKKKFIRKQYLKAHLLSHTGETPFKCDICEKSYTSKWHLQEHKRTHTGEKPFKCDCCEKSFTKKGSLQKHMEKSLSHSQDHLPNHTGLKQFECECCGKKFKEKQYLKNHLLIHTGEKPFQCDICEKSFSLKWSLQEHMRTHTREKPYKCDYCEKSFTLRGTLRNHLLTHTGEKPFKCEICEKSFPRKSRVHEHMRTHTGEKPFECDICKRKFPKKWHLQIHMQTHTGEKPFKCDYCKKKFARKQYFKTHLLRHTVT